MEIQQADKIQDCLCLLLATLGDPPGLIQKVPIITTVKGLLSLSKEPVKVHNLELGCPHISVGKCFLKAAFIKATKLSKLSNQRKKRNSLKHFLTFLKHKCS